MLFTGLGRPSGGTQDLGHSFSQYGPPGRWITYTAISRKVVGENVHATIPKGNMGYVQFTVPDTVAVEPTFVAFL